MWADWRPETSITCRPGNTRCMIDGESLCIPTDGWVGGRGGYEERLSAYRLACEQFNEQTNVVSLGQ